MTSRKNPSARVVSLAYIHYLQLHFSKIIREVKDPPDESSIDDGIGREYGRE
jgi:hypothetical protein